MKFSEGGITFSPDIDFLEKTLATDQTKNKKKRNKKNPETCFFWLKGSEREREEQKTHFHCVRPNLFSCRTKWYSESTRWSRCLTQFYSYVPYAMTWEKRLWNSGFCVFFVIWFAPFGRLTSFVLFCILFSKIFLWCILFWRKKKKKKERKKGGEGQRCHRKHLCTLSDIVPRTLYIDLRVNSWVQ